MHVALTARTSHFLRIRDVSRILTPDRHQCHALTGLLRLVRHFTDRICLNNVFGPFECFHARTLLFSEVTSCALVNENEMVQVCMLSSSYPWETCSVCHARTRLREDGGHVLVLLWYIKHGCFCPQSGVKNCEYKSFGGQVIGGQDHLSLSFRSWLKDTHLAVYLPGPPCTSDRYSSLNCLSTT